MAVLPAERVRILERGKVTVGRQVDSVTAGAVDAYVRAWTSTRDDLVAAAADAARQARETGDERNPAAYRTARLQQALDGLTVELQRLGSRTGVQVTNVVPPVMEVPRRVLRDLTAGAVQLNRVPAGELRAIVQRQQEKIASDYLVLSVDAERGLRDGLLRGVTRGSSVADTARGILRQTQATTAQRLGIGSAAELEAAPAAIVDEVRQAFAGGMQRALVLARTELIDASRVATTASYLAAPDVVAGWEWMATLDPRTCGACWGMHGEVFPPDAHQEGHQQCRCTQSPLLVGERPGENGLQDSRQAFDQLTADQQRQVLGPARLKAYQDGVPLRAMAQRRDNRGWRAGNYVTPVRDLPDPGAAELTAPAPAPRDPLDDLEQLSDDDVAALMLRDDVLADEAALARVYAELDRRDEQDATAPVALPAPRELADIIRTGARTDAEDQAVSDYYRAMQAADDAARAAKPDVLPPPRTGTPAQRLREEFEVNLHSAILAADSATKGAMFSRDGVKAGASERTLFEGDSVRAVRYASEELRTYWRENPNSRVTFEQFRSPGGKRAMATRRAFQAALDEFDSKDRRGKRRR